MSVTYQLRRAIEADIPAILSCFRAAIFSINEKIYSKSQKDAWVKKGTEDTQKWVERVLDQHFLIVEINNELISFASASNAGYIDMLFTHPSFQQQGIASLLYFKLEKYALEKQIRSLETHASAISKPFFKTKGFELIAENKFSLYDVPISNYHFKKALR